MKGFILLQSGQFFLPALRSHFVEKGRRRKIENVFDFIAGSSNIFFVSIVAHAEYCTVQMQFIFVFFFVGKKFLKKKNKRKQPPFSLFFCKMRKANLYIKLIGYPITLILSKYASKSEFNVQTLFPPALLLYLTATEEKENDTNSCSLFQKLLSTRKFRIFNLLLHSLSLIRRCRRRSGSLFNILLISCSVSFPLHRSLCGTVSYFTVCKRVKISSSIFILIIHLYVPFRSLNAFT